jgi:hypothetical protein
MARAALQPPLHQRRHRRERKEWKAETSRQRCQQPPHRSAGFCRRRIAKAQGKQPEGRSHDDDVECLAPGAEPTNGEVRVEVSKEQGCLEEQHAGAPDCGTSPETRQHHLREHGLHEKEQRGRYEGGRGEGSPTDNRNRIHARWYASLVPDRCH